MSMGYEDRLYIKIKERWACKGFCFLVGIGFKIW
uniref:Uncharacterized protein n=1 Tax=Rhizophora mucronata TaxID=61149 RepID=A0A2P2QD24_RHIMU